MSKHSAYKERYKKIQEENARKEANRQREVRIKELQRKRAGLQSQADVLYTKFNEQKNAINAVGSKTDAAINQADTANNKADASLFRMSEANNKVQDIEDTDTAQDAFDKVFPI